MKHHDSIEQANKKISSVLKLLAQWYLPPTPINYAVAYDYISEKNTVLITAVDQQLLANNKLDAFFIEETYREYILGQSAFRDEIIDDIDDLVSDFQKSCQQSTKATRTLIKHVDQDLEKIESGDEYTIRAAVTHLKQATIAFKQEQLKLTKQIIASEQQTTSLKDELAEVRKELYMDPITGLYNKKALAKHFDAWITQDPAKQIAAVVINVDNFAQFSQKFGHLIGDVILSKIAAKVGRYVDDSGLPVRTGHDEFLILLPEMETSIASEIAEKIRQGVEKIRFISSKSGVRLPQMTISLGVSQFKQKEQLQSFVKRTRDALSQAQQTGKNQVVVA